MHFLNIITQTCMDWKKKKKKIDVIPVVQDGRPSLATQ